MGTLTRTLALIGLLALSLTIGACQGASLSGDNTATGNPGDPFPAAPRANGTRPMARGGTVAVSDRDLAPVDAYFSAGRGGANTRWILGDTVDVVASREYFAGILSVNRGPFVSRSDKKLGDDMLVTLTFLGSPNQASASNNPRVQLGTGLTVTASRVLRVRLVKTRDARAPVRLHITARGQARQGHREHIIKRGDVITMGGNLVAEGGRWVWRPIDG